MFVNVLGKIQVLQKGTSNISPKSILVSDIEYNPSLGKTRTEAETIIIIGIAFRRSGVIKNTSAQGDDIGWFDEQILEAKANRVRGIDVRVLFRSATYGGGFVALRVLEEKIIPFGSGDVC